MSVVTDKSAEPQGQERYRFLAELYHFHDLRGTTLPRKARIQGREVDLYRLYILVTGRGGWIKVNNRNEWDNVLEDLNSLKGIVNGGVALKEIYIRYLDRYEKSHFLGGEGEQGGEDDENSRHRRWSARALHTVPLNYNYQQHNIAESARFNMGLSCDLYSPSDYDRLLLSLCAPLPNEQDFGINICTLLSNDSKQPLHLEKCPRILDVLLGHAGVFNHPSLRDLLSEVYSATHGHSLHTFWKDTLVGPKEFLELTNELMFLHKYKTPTLIYSENDQLDTFSNNSKLVVMNDDSDIESDLFASDSTERSSNFRSFSNNDTDDLNKEGLCLGRSLGMQDYIGQRILQVASILRNLSFCDENVNILAHNKTFLRFLLLCANSKWGNLHNLGLDMLGNIAMDVTINDPSSDVLSDCLLNTITRGLSCSDRAVILSCLEVLNKLSQREDNEEILLRCLDQNIFEQVCMFLTLHDIMLLIYTLECLYAITSLGERVCNSIVRVHGVIDTLVSLVTVEAQTYGPRACILMRVVETVSGTVSSSAGSPTNTATGLSSPLLDSSNGANSNNINNGRSPATTDTRSPGRPQSPAAVVTTTMSSDNNALATSTVAQMLHVNKCTTTKPLFTLNQTTTSTQATDTTSVQDTTAIITPSIVPSIAPVNSVQMQHAHQQAIQENEQFALAWLRSTFEPTLGKIEQQELYRHYLNSCSKIGRKGVISPLHFPRCVRSVFGGSVGPNLKKENNETVYYYDGIKIRNTPLLVQFKSIHTNSTDQTKSTNYSKSDVNKCSKGNVGPGSESQTGQDVSPILVAQLSAPNKPAAVKLKGKTPQITSHPHLSQALLTEGSNQVIQMQTNPQTSLNTFSGNLQRGNTSIVQNNSSLIKSLLANKVTEGTATASTGMNYQVAQRQHQQRQRLVAEQMQCSSPTPTVQEPSPAPAPIRKANKNTMKSAINGLHSPVAKQLPMEVDPESLISSTTIVPIEGIRRSGSVWDPPPPLAPLSMGQGGVILVKIPKIDEDSNSTGNNSMASSTGLSTFLTHGQDNTYTEDHENSLTSFEGILLNGIPNTLNIDSSYDDSNSKDSMKNSFSHKINSNKMLADLLEKKSIRPVLQNGLKNDHNIIFLSKDGSEMLTTEDTLLNNNQSERQSLKRPYTDSPVGEVKRIHLSSDFVDSKSCDNSETDSTSRVNGDDNGGNNVSSTAANLYAALAASTVEDDEEEESQQTDFNNLQVFCSVEDQSSSSQIIVPQSHPLTSNNQLTMSMQSSAPVQHTVPVVMQPQQRIHPGQILVSNPQAQMHQVQLMGSRQSGQVHIVSGASQPGQYMLSSPYVMQQQSSMVHGQTQTVLVAQTQQQQGTGSKTIIILQSQGSGGQKVVMTPQGQQVLVAQRSNTLQNVQTAAGSQVCLTSTIGSSTKNAVLSQNQTGNASTNTQQYTLQPQLCYTLEQSNSDLIFSTQINNTSVPTVKQEPIIIKQESVEQNCKSRTLESFENSDRNVNNSVDSGCSSELNLNVECSADVEEQEELQGSSNWPWTCSWKGCIKQKHRSANEVYLHVCEAHCPCGPMEVMCQWGGSCDNMPRSRFSLMTHLYDKHCSAEILKVTATKRNRHTSAGQVEPEAPLSCSPHPGYAPNAALHAIKRHALEFVNPKELLDDNEGPVTKSIRLTASLILRNIVIYSSAGRRFLRSYEPHLASVALSNVESSRTIAQVLYDMNENTGLR